MLPITNKPFSTKNFFLGKFNLDKISKFTSIMSNYIVNNFLVVNFLISGLIVFAMGYKDIYNNGGLLGLIFSVILIVTFSAIASFLIEDFKLSKNIYFRFVQIFIFRALLLSIVIFIVAYYFFHFESIGNFILNSAPEENVNNLRNISLSIETDKLNKQTYSVSMDNDTATTISKGIVDGITAAAGNILPNMGYAAAGASVTSTLLKTTPALPATAKLAVATVSTGLVAASAKIGVEIATEISENANLSGLVKESPHANPSPDKIPSPTETQFNINSPLEEGDITSPLQNLLLYSYTLDIIILLLILLLFFIIFNRYVYVHNSNFISSKLSKYIPIKIRNFFNTSIDFNNKFMLVMFIFISFLILFDSMLNIIISYELYTKIDDYIEVHKFIHFKNK